MIYDVCWIPYWKRCLAWSRLGWSRTWTRVRSGILRSCSRRWPCVLWEGAVSPPGVGAAASGFQCWGGIRSGYGSGGSSGVVLGGRGVCLSIRACVCEWGSAAGTNCRRWCCRHPSCGDARSRSYCEVFFCAGYCERVVLAGSMGFGRRRGAFRAGARGAARARAWGWSGAGGPRGARGWLTRIGRGELRRGTRQWRSRAACILRNCRRRGICSVRSRGRVLRRRGSHRRGCRVVWRCGVLWGIRGRLRRSLRCRCSPFRWERWGACGNTFWGGTSDISFPWKYSNTSGNRRSRGKLHLKSTYAITLLWHAV